VFAQDVLARPALGRAAGQDVREAPDDLPRLAIALTPLLLPQRQRLERATRPRHVREQVLGRGLPRGCAVGDPAELGGLDVEARLEAFGRRGTGCAPGAQDHDGDGHTGGQAEHGEPDLVHAAQQRREGV
jgi:hypothetical protein